MNSLYLECNSGISGDMTVAALLDLGADKDVLYKALDSINDKSFHVHISRVKKSGIDCLDFDVHTDIPTHDHDMAYLHSSDHHEIHTNCDTNEHEHAHEHSHEHSHEHNHDHHHGRNLNDIIEIINECDMTDTARKLAIKIFEIVAKAESKAHNLPLEQVHFHEVGAIDSIVDIISASVCYDNLVQKFNISSVIIPKLVEGTGFVRCQHGVLPIPVPATANIVASSSLKLEICDIQGEFVTPTGAAIAAAIISDSKLPSNGFTIEAIGTGAGKRTYEKPSMLRAMIIKNNTVATNDISSSNTDTDNTIIKLESNIDDCTGEELGFVMDLLFNAGARDVFYTPVFMKKNRPAVLLSVICTEDNCSNLERIIFENTTTIGIRRQTMKRTTLPRKLTSVNTKFGEAKIKICDLYTNQRAYPEYDSVVEIAKSNNLSYREAYNEIVQSYFKQDV